MMNDSMTEERPITHLPGVGFWSFKKDGHHSIDKTCCSLLRLPTQESSFENFISTIDDEDLENFKESSLFQLMTSWWQLPTLPQKMSFVVKIKGDETRFIRGSGFIITEEDSPVEVKGLIEDITEEKLLEQKKLERLTRMALLGELGFSINHETLNPLSVISLCSGHMKALLGRNEIDKEKLQNCLVVMNKAVDKTAKIIKSMRVFNEGQNPKAFEKIHLKDIVQDSLELCQDRIRWYDIELSVDVSPEIVLECRPVQVSQILMNLILNSVLSIKDLKERWIKIWTVVKDGWLQIHVQDSGKGIPFEIQGQIMKPFFSTRNGDGTGMGLYISRNFANQHHGRLSYDRVSQNTLFIVELPLVQKK